MLKQPKLSLLEFLLIISPYHTIAQITTSDEVFSSKIEFSTTDFCTNLSGAKTNFSSVVTFHNNVYFVYCDSDRRPIIGKIDSSGTVQTSYLDKDESIIYAAQDNGHHIFSIGVDKMGYIHITGDTHANYFKAYPDLLLERFQGAPYLSWVSDQPESIDSFEFIGTDTDRTIPGFAFTYFSFHNDMNGTLYAQYRSRIHEVSLPSGSNGWCLSRYDETTRTWKVLGAIPNSSNPKGIYPAVIWEQAGHFNEADPTTSFYQAYMSDINFDFNNRMHIAATINSDSTFETDTHVIYAYSDDSGANFKRSGGETIKKLPIRPTSGDQQGSIVDSIGNPAFDGISNNASVVFDMNGKPAVSFLPLKERTTIAPDDHDHYRYWVSSQEGWSDLILSPQESQTGSEHFLDCNGIITFAGARTWNAQIYRTTGFNKEGYTAFALPEESSTVSMSGVDERALREKNVIRWMIENDESLMIVSSKFDPSSLSPLPDKWKQNNLGLASGNSGMYNNVLQVKSSGAGVLADGSLDLQFINTSLEVDGGVQARIINIDYSDGAFGGLMLSENTDGTGNFYLATIDYKGIKAFSNTGKGGNAHYISPEMNEPSEWLKIIRLGNTIEAYHSDNGNDRDWVLFDSFQIELPSSISVGLVSGSGGSWIGTTRADKLQSFEGETPLSINSFETNKNLEIFPNPSYTTIKIKSPIPILKDQLATFDVRGVRVNNYSVNQTETNIIEIDISNLKQGIYYLTTDGKNKGKFIKNYP